MRALSAIVYSRYPLVLIVRLSTDRQRPKKLGLGDSKKETGLPGMDDLKSPALSQDWFQAWHRPNLVFKAGSAVPLNAVQCRVPTRMTHVTTSPESLRMAC